MAHGNATFSAGNTTIVAPPADATIVDNPVSTTVGALILSIVFLLGFPGNLFIIWSILARAKRHSVTTLLILNLAIADGSLMALTPFFIAYLVSKDWPFGEAMCKVLFYLCLLNMYASIQLIMLMSVYRMLAVLWPQWVARISGRKTVARVLAVLWALVMIASIPAIVFRKVGKKSNSNKMVCDSFHEEDERSRMPTVRMAMFSPREFTTNTQLDPPLPHPLRRWSSSTCWSSSWAFSSPTPSSSSATYASYDASDRPGSAAASAARISSWPLC